MGRWSTFAPVTALVLMLLAGGWLFRSHRLCNRNLPVRIVNVGDVELVDVSIAHVGYECRVGNIKPGETGYVWLHRMRFEGKPWGTTATLNFRYASGGAVSTSVDLPETPSRLRLRVGPWGPFPSVTVARTPWWVPLLR